MNQRAPIVKTPATYQDVLDAPPNMIAQIIAGELHTQPRPAFPHDRAASGLGIDIGGSFDRGRDGPGGWWIIFEPEFHLGGDILVPDIAGWRRERMPQCPDGAYTDIAPDWVCEILSPSTMSIDRIKKMPIYAREGVAHAWRIDPAAKTLEAYALEGWRRVVIATHGGEDKAEIPPFATIGLDLSGL